MQVEEARWFGRKISEMDPSEIYPMCNVGSATADLRTRQQPWIDEYIFKPARERQQMVEHLDIVSGPGVDIVGDLTDPRFLAALAKRRFKSVFCTNLLEHVPNREDIAKVLTAIIPVGGYIFVSCPFRYPFHASPIDTMFRPDVDELVRLFPQTNLVYGDIITDGTFLRYAHGWTLLKKVARLLLPFYRPSGWLTTLLHLPWLFRPFQATCLVLRKTPAEQLSRSD